jgi:DHA2 family metal-tetracycline-proton antiporter-like MFS transporter
VLPSPPPYLGGGAASWFLVSGSAQLRFPVLAAAAAVVAVVLGTAMIALLFTGMALGSLAASTAQGALGLRAREAATRGIRPTAMGLCNLWYLLGVRSDRRSPRWRLR